MQTLRGTAIKKGDLVRFAFAGLVGADGVEPPTYAL